MRLADGGGPVQEENRARRWNDESNEPTEEDRGGGHVGFYRGPGLWRAGPFCCPEVIVMEVGEGGRAVAWHTGAARKARCGRHTKCWPVCRGRVLLI